MLRDKIKGSRLSLTTYFFSFSQVWVSEMATDGRARSLVPGSPWSAPGSSTMLGSISLPGNPDIQSSYLATQIYNQVTWQHRYTFTLPGNPDTQSHYLATQLHSHITWQHRYTFTLPGNTDTHSHYLANQIHNHITWQRRYTITLPGNLDTQSHYLAT